jgi:hypothetical protein
MMLFDELCDLVERYVAAEPWEGGGATGGTTTWVERVEKVLQDVLHEVVNREGLEVPHEE